MRIARFNNGNWQQAMHSMIAVRAAICLSVRQTNIRIDKHSTYAKVRSTDYHFLGINYVLERVDDHLTRSSV